MVFKLSWKFLKVAVTSYLVVYSSIRKYLQNFRSLCFPGVTRHKNPVTKQVVVAKGGDSSGQTDLRRRDGVENVFPPRLVLAGMSA